MKKTILVTKASFLTDGEKQMRVLMNNLPKKNKVYKLIKEKGLTDEEMKQLCISFSIVGSMDRKIIANSVLIAITLKTREREIKQITRELMRRHKTRAKYTPNQRAFFEDLLLFGWGTQKEKNYIRREIISIINGNEEVEKKFNFYTNSGIDLKSIVQKLRRKDADYEKIFNEYLKNPKYSELARNKLEGIRNKAKNSITLVSKEIMRIRKGQQRPYVGKGTSNESY